MTSFPVLEWLGAGGGGALLTKAFDYVATRGRSKAYTMGAVDHAVQTAMGLVTDRLEKVEGQHAECEKNLRDVQADLAGAKVEISRLMQGPPAGYQVNDLKRVGK